MVWFAEMAPEGYRQAAFLTPRMAPMGEMRYGFNLDDVLLRDRSVPVGGAPMHFIFISAFCCSTLLARLLDSTGALVLREPTVLGQVSMLRYPPNADPGWEEEWRTLAELSIRLLGRAFSPGQTVIVKAADVCNAMADVILASQPEARAILLSVGLRTFILSVLKQPERRKWIRQRVRFWQRAMPGLPAPPAPATCAAASEKVEAGSGNPGEEAVGDGGDAERAAFCWVANMARWELLRQATERGRLMAMDGEEVAAEPAAALDTARAFLRLGTGDGNGDGTAHEAAGRHAKFGGRPYDAAQRRADLADWERRFVGEADRAVEWARPLLERLRISGGARVAAPSPAKRAVGGEPAAGPELHEPMEVTV